MKLPKIIALFLSLFFLHNANTQNLNKKVLLNIEDEKITVEEFLTMYQKNRITAQPIEINAIEKYLDLYINFRLKIIEAKSLGLDTLQRLNDELAGYRKQLAEPYFYDQQVNDQLLQEAYERLLKDIRVSHILVLCEENANPSDSLEAFYKLTIIKQKAFEGVSFKDLASKYSEDPSAKDQVDENGEISNKGNAGDLGYFSVFDMVYPFEDAAYKAKIGEITGPIRTKYGFHLIKVTDKRESIGKVSVAHIFLSNPTSSNNIDSEDQSEKIQHIYQELQGGVDFNKLVIKFSEDRGSKSKGGLLPSYHSNNVVPEFYLAITEIGTIGNYSKPVQTKYGWHIIKLVDQEKNGSFIEEKSRLTNQIAKDSRSRKSKEIVVQMIKEKYHFKEYISAKKELITLMESNWLNGTWNAKMVKNPNKKLFKFRKLVKVQNDLVNYIQHQQIANQLEGEKVDFNKLYYDFVNQTCLVILDQNLENDYPEFKSIMQEYQYGVILFELIDQKIWKKALNDIEGLKTYFDQNKERYDSENLSEIKGILIADYQEYLEKKWVKELRNKYSFSVNNKILSQLIE